MRRLSMPEVCLISCMFSWHDLEAIYKVETALAIWHALCSAVSLDQ